MYEEKCSYIPPQIFEIGQEATYIIQQDETVSVAMNPVHVTIMFL